MSENRNFVVLKGQYKKIAFGKEGFIIPVRLESFLRLAPKVCKK